MVPTKPEGYAKRHAMMLKNVFKDEKFRVDGVEFNDMTCSIGTAKIKDEIAKVRPTRLRTSSTTTVRWPLLSQGQRQRLHSQLTQKQPHSLSPKRPPQNTSATTTNPWLIYPVSTNPGISLRSTPTTSISSEWLASKSCKPAG